ncbi:hypothetical protein EVAR_93119_1 [Eumeta japonica]|uniref:Uncharacterized protein n=1 Tax=Eumeta variegata TaxID=151549 RepID=A0A4C1TI96_EUMVA|nr:hypothetical protein EVAR_93119_1 [Eumeta japonica]
MSTPCLKNTLSPRLRTITAAPDPRWAAVEGLSLKFHILREEFCIRSPCASAVALRAFVLSVACLSLQVFAFPQTKRKGFKMLLMLLMRELLVNGYGLPKGTYVPKVLIVPLQSHCALLQSFYFGLKKFTHLKYSHMLQGGLTAADDRCQKWNETVRNLATGRLNLPYKTRNE